jgi:hypothetical protein
METGTSASRTVPCMETLEARELLAAGGPTAYAQYLLELINRARANPVAEGNRLSAAAELADISLTNHLVVGFPPGSSQAGDVTEGLLSPNNIVGARPPLAMNPMLLATARAHSLDMYNRDYFAHDTKSPPTQTWDQRINAGGYTGSIGENIAEAGSSGGGLVATAAQLGNILMIDHNQAPDRGHRVNLLDTHVAPYFREIGIGYYHNDTRSTSLWMTDVITEDFGNSGAGPFIVGVVYNDTNSNSFYDIGEGMAGVTLNITTAAGVYAVTGTAGGFAFPYTGTSGTVTVQATGGAFGSSVATKVVTRTGENVKVDFKLSDAVITDSDGDGLADTWEIAHFGNLAQTAAGDPDGDGYSNLAEFNAGTDPMNAASNPGASPPTPPKSGGGGGGGGCGLTGLEAFLLLGLLRVRRR